MYIEKLLNDDVAYILSDMPIILLALSEGYQLVYGSAINSGIINHQRSASQIPAIDHSQWWLPKYLSWYIQNAVGETSVWVKSLIPWQKWRAWGCSPRHVGQTLRLPGSWDEPPLSPARRALWSINGPWRCMPNFTPSTSTDTMPLEWHELKDYSSISDRISRPPVTVFND